MTHRDDDEISGVKLAFERDIVVLRLDQIVPLKSLRPGAKESKKYAQILCSVRAIGLVEAPVVTPIPSVLIATSCSMVLYALRRSGIRGA